MNSKRIYKVLFVMILILGCNSQSHAQGLMLKSNLLCDVSGTFSLGAEYSLTPKTSLSLMTSYNPWESEDNIKRKYFLVQAEYRKWLTSVLSGFFVGAQLNYGQFNIGGKMPWWIESFDLLENNRYQGDLYGLGATSGYQWILSPRLNLEVAASLGFAHIRYDKYELEPETPRLDQGLFNYIGVTQLGVTLVYYLK